MRKVLILGGTTEGVQVANKLSEDQSLILITSLAGRTQSPNKVRGLLRTGGFGGIEGLVRYLDTENISAVLDATHPFATQMTRNALSACARAQVPFADSLGSRGRLKWVMIGRTLRILPVLLERFRLVRVHS